MINVELYNWQSDDRCRYGPLSQLDGGKLTGSCGLCKFSLGTDLYSLKDERIADWLKILLSWGSSQSPSGLGLGFAIHKEPGTDN